MTREERLAYLAGIFDGEGSVGIYWGRRIYHGRKSDHDRGVWTLRVRVGNLSRSLVVLCHQVFGGSRAHVVLNGHRIDGTPKYQWIWTVTGHGARRALVAMLPYLIVKKAQAEEALKMPISVIGHRHSVQDREQIISLASRLREMKKEVA